MCVCVSVHAHTHTYFCYNTDTYKLNVCLFFLSFEVSGSAADELFNKTIKWPVAWILFNLLPRSSYTPPHPLSGALPMVLRANSTLPIPSMYRSWYSYSVHWLATEWIKIAVNKLNIFVEQTQFCVFRFLWQQLFKWQLTLAVYTLHNGLFQPYTIALSLYTCYKT